MITISLCYRVPMRTKLITVILIAVLLAIAFQYGLQRGSRINEPPESVYISAVSGPGPNSESIEQKPNATADRAYIEDDGADFDRRFARIERWLETANPEIAARYVNDHYGEFSSDQLEQIKTRFLENPGQSQSVLQQLQAGTSVFDDLESWDALARAASQMNQWTIAFDALMRTSALQNNPIELETNLTNIVRVGSHLRAGLEQRGDELGIKSLYQRAYELHPTYPRFQLELAYAHLRLNETDDARRLLSSLVFDPDFGEVAQQALTQIETNRESGSLDPARVAKLQRSDVVVPLLRTGNSFLVDTAINNQSTRLLLDTGASITALSSDLIQRLNLPSTGRTIQLNTANGTRSARLFSADKLKLGRLQLVGLQVAEIELEPTAGFDGLLGTDALNLVDMDYSYVIDNNQNALIFRRR